MTTLKTVAALTATIGLCACGGGSSSPTPSPATAAIPMAATPAPTASATKPMAFADVTANGGVSHSSSFTTDYDAMPRHFAGGGAGGDLDGDGDIDLVITRGDLAPILVLENDGQARFTDRAALGDGLHRAGAPGLADLDGDGDLDVLIGGLDAAPSFVFRNDGDLAFTDVTPGSGLDAMTSTDTQGFAFADVDGDGDLDVAMAHWGTPRDALAPGETETLWRNDSTNDRIQLTPIGVESGISAALKLSLPTGVLGVDHDYGFAPGFADLDGDGAQDLLLVADFRGTQVFKGAGDGTFTDITDPTQITDSNGMGTAIGDFDGDGDPDWFVSSIDGNRLYTNRAGILAEVTARSGTTLGGWGWGSCAADFDLDGDLDIYQTNGWVSDSGAGPNMPYTSDRTRLWVNAGDGSFVDGAPDANIDDDLQGRGVVCADFDGDRDTDILLLLNASARGAVLWRNDANIQGLSVDARLPSGAPAIGTKLVLTSDARTQTRWISANSNFGGQNPSAALFGIEGTASLTAIFPDGTVVTRDGVRPAQSYVLTPAQ